MDPVKALRLTFERNCTKLDRGETPEGIHVCFVCGREFNIANAVYCPKCDWWISECGHCGCNLSPSDRLALENAFVTICGGTCRLNPKKRKKRSGGTWVCVKCGYHHSDRWVSEYGMKCQRCGGELRFESLR